MGRPKLLLDLRGKPVIRHTVERLVAAHMDEILVVVGPEHAALEKALDGLGVRLVVNPAPEAGQGSSVSAGVQALSARTTAAQNAGVQNGTTRRSGPSSLMPVRSSTAPR